MTWGSVRRYPTAFGRLGPTETAPLNTSPTLIDEEHLIDEELLADLVRNWSIPCEYRHSPSLPACGAPATYWVICRVCEHAWAECATHRATESAKWAIHPDELVKCGHCGAIRQQRDWRLLVTIIPIGARP